MPCGCPRWRRTFLRRGFRNSLSWWWLPFVQSLDYLSLPDTRLASLIAALAAALPYIAVRACTATRLTSSRALILARRQPYSAQALPPAAFECLIRFISDSRQ